MQPNELQSYRRFMREHLFDHIDIPAQNIHIPDGTLKGRRRLPLLPGLREGDRGCRRAGLPDPGRRTHRPRRLQRTRLRQRKPHPPHYPRQGYAPGRGQRFLRRAIRPPPRHHHGRGNDPQVAARGAAGLRRAQGAHHRPDARGSSRPGRAGQLPPGTPQCPDHARPRRRRRADPLQEPVGAGADRMERPPGAQGRDLAGPPAREADPQAHRRGLQRGRPPGSAGQPRPGLRPEHHRLPRSTGHDHRLARRQACRGQARRPPPHGRRYLPQARGDLLAPPRRRRDLDGRHAHPPGGSGTPGSCGVSDFGQHRRV